MKFSNLKMTQLIYVVFLLNLFALMHANAQNKKALIIANGNYQDETRWTNISSANDVPLIEGALIAQGFDKSNISVVKDATRKQVEEAIEKLIKNTEEGDVILLHYSGHGQQIFDDNGDEIDGYDEALVPVDAHIRFEKGVYEGENHIRDDELGKWLEKLQKKAGKTGSVLLIMDSCHSGTASRGLGKSRGTQETFAPPGVDAAANAKKESGQFGLEMGAEKSKNLAPLICIYGASAHELNYETTDENGNGVGSLSYAFSQAFSNAQPTQTYAELFDQIKVKMAVSAPRQSPQAEGNLNRAVLGGNITGKAEYYHVIRIYSGNSFQMDGGNLMGIYNQTEVAVIPFGEAEKPENYIASGTVVFTDATTADVDLSTEITEEQLRNAKVVVTKQNYGSMSVSVDLELADDAIKNQIVEAFAQHKIIETKEEGAELIVEDDGANLILNTASEYKLFAGAKAEGDAAIMQLTKSVLAFAQAKYLRKIEMANEDLNVQFQFIPITAKQVGRGTWAEDQRFGLSAKQDESGNIKFEAGDFFKIKVVNDGYEVAYFSLLDFQPDNQIGVLIPGKYQNAADFVIKPGEAKELPTVFRFGPPYGTEVFKLVASKTPIDFRSILLQKGAHRGAADGADNPFAELMSDSFRGENQSRGSETMSVAPGNCNIQSVTFSIVKKQP